MKRIVHFSTAHGMIDTRIMLKECQSLAKEGYDVHLVISAPRDQIVQGVNVHALPEKGGRLYRMGIKPVIALRKVLSLKPDLVHFHDPELLFCALFLRLIGKTVVYDAHEDLPRQISYKLWVRPALRKPLAMLMEWIENAIARRLNAIITATPHIADRFIRINKNTVSISNYALSGELVPVEGMPWEQRERSIIYVGNFTPERGGYELIEAAKCSGIKTHIAGTAYPDTMKDALQAAHDRGEVIWHGNLKRASLLPLLQSSRGGVVCFHPLPNHTEAQPNKFFEYMSAGLPVISSNFLLWRSLIENEKCGLCIDPADVKALVQAMAYLVSNDAEASAMGMRGRAAVQSIYNWENEAQKLFRLYADLLSEK